MSSRLLRSNACFPIAAAVGVVPLLLGALFATRLHQTLSALLLFPLVVGAVRGDSTRRGLAVFAFAFGAHSASAILLARFFPEVAERCMPDGADYFAKNLHWIRTGEDPEYVTANWLPAHVQLTFAVILFGFVSLGLIPFLEGFYELDLMNYYVGRLLAESHDAPISLVLGWHPWSVARGCGYALLIFEITSLSYARLVGRSLSSARVRALRWSLAAGFLLLDAGLKYGLLEPVRSRLLGALSA